GTLLKGVLNFQPDPTVLQIVVWLAYLAPTLAFFFGVLGGGPAKPTAPKPTTGTTGTTEARPTA
ncbi:iron transporter, partial [Kitasatospora purpeofusca]